MTMDQLPTNPFDQFKAAGDPHARERLFEQLTEIAVRLDREATQGAGVVARLLFEDAINASEDIIEAWDKLPPEARAQLRESTAALARTIKDKAEAAYQRSDLFDRRRDLMERWAAFLNPETADVVSITTGRAES